MRIDKRNYIYLYPFALVACWIAAWLLQTRLVSLSSNASAFWICAKLVIWVAPIFLLIRLVERSDSRHFLDLTNPLRGLLVGLLIGLILVGLFYAFDRVFTSNQPHALPALSLALLNGAIVAPLVEEIVFRGFYLRKLMLSGITFWLANGMTTVFFVGMHLPGWYFQGKLSAGSLIAPVLSLAFFSLVMGLVKVRTQSLYATIVIHAVNNLYSLAH